MSTPFHTVIFPGYYTSLARIGEVARQASQEAGFDEKMTYSVESAVDEACSNIIEHAYSGEGHGDITLGWSISALGLVVTLEDNGRPFDPHKIPKPDLKAPLQDREGHGLGLFYIHKYMDEVHYEALPDGRNLLTMIKHRKDRHAPG